MVSYPENTLSSARFRSGPRVPAVRLPTSREVGVGHPPARFRGAEALQTTRGPPMEAWGRPARGAILDKYLLSKASPCFRSCTTILRNPLNLPTLGIGRTVVQLPERSFLRQRPLPPPKPGRPGLTALGKEFDWLAQIKLSGPDLSQPDRKNGTWECPAPGAKATAARS